jgi:hypothetical protein
VALSFAPIARSELPSLNSSIDKDEFAMRIALLCHEDSNRIIDRFNMQLKDWQSHLKEEAERKAEIKRLRQLRAKFLTWIYGLIAALIVSMFGAWVQHRLGTNKAETVSQSAIATRTELDKKQPSTEETFNNGWRQGAEAEGRRVREDLTAQIPMVPPRCVKGAKPPCP